MRILSVILIVIIALMGQGFAQAIQGEFIPSQNLTQVKEGDIFEATIRVWPIENVDLTQFNKLEKTVLFNSLYMIEITNLGVSKNNADVVEMNALFIVKSSKVEQSHSFKYNDSIINMQLSALAISDLDDQSKDFYIVEQSINKSVVWKILLGLILTLFVLIILKRKAIKKYFLGLRSNSSKINRKKYSELFNRANKREDFEVLYQDKDEWMKLLTEKAPAHYDFLKTVNMYQFKKDWSNSEIEEVKNSFEIIRRSFEK